MKRVCLIDKKTIKIYMYAYRVTNELIPKEMLKAFLNLYLGWQSVLNKSLGKYSIGVDSCWRPAPVGPGSMHFPIGEG